MVARRGGPFSLPLSRLLSNLRMTSIITVMKLGRDSESGVYRTFHNPAMSPNRWDGEEETVEERIFDR